jgi:G3E family GTPase
MKTVVSLVVASTAKERETAIIAAIGNARSGSLPYAVLLEGLPDGQDRLHNVLTNYAIPMIRIAAGCLCCSGNVILRVNLNRLLRHRPQRLFIGIASSSHHQQLRTLLQQAPYDAWLNPGPDLLALEPDSLQTQNCT